MTGRDMTEAALAVLAGLTEEQRVLVHLPLADPSRETWMYWPREMTGDRYAGVGLHRLTFEQRKLVMRLLATAVSLPTLAQIAAIMALDLPLDASEGFARTELRDPLRYWVAVYGEPGGPDPWGWQLEGHHVAVNHVIAGDEIVASTPHFLGANPAVIRHRGHVVSRPCGPEEDAARALLASLAGQQLHHALLSAPAPVDLVTHRLSRLPPVVRPGEHPHPLDAFRAHFAGLGETERNVLTVDSSSPVGVARGDLDASGRALLDDLIEVYVGRLAEGAAAAELARLRTADVDRIHFAWAGSTEPGEPHYYRLHGPSILVEYDCVQDRANHVHAVWRDPQRDFGRDPLRAHLAADHDSASRRGAVDVSDPDRGIE